MSTTMTGRAQRRMTPKLRFSLRSITVPPMKKAGERTKCRMIDSEKSTTCVMSFVILVTSDPVVKRSVCSIESDMTLRYAALRRSLPIP